MKIIAEETWSYVLFDDGERWILTILMGGVGVYAVSIKLTEEQINCIKDDIANAARFVETVRDNFKEFSGQELEPPIWPESKSQIITQ